MKFKVADGKGPLGRKDASKAWTFGPFLEGATYDCNVFSDDVKKALGKKWLKEGKIEIVEAK